MKDIHPSDAGTKNSDGQYCLDDGRAGAPKKVEQGPNKSLLKEHELQHVDYGALTGGESTPL